MAAGRAAMIIGLAQNIKRMAQAALGRRPRAGYGVQQRAIPAPETSR
jgi:hypothetical protein